MTSNWYWLQLVLINMVLMYISVARLSPYFYIYTAYIFTCCCVSIHHELLRDMDFFDPLTNGDLNLGYEDLC